jgi:D-sedoheptulose 7-phosphate isomerase
MQNTIKNIIKESIKAKEAVYASQTANIEKAAKAIIESLKNGGKLLIFGNGGSAADSQHIAAELVGRFKKERKAFAAIALTTNTSTMTALANDYSYDVIFSREVEALGKKGDVVLGISTSGNSKNVIEGLRKARSMGLATISFTGGDGGALKKDSDICIVVGTKDTPRIQESHLMIAHIICELVEEWMAK